MNDKVAWLLLGCGVAILILGLAPYSSNPNTRFLPALAAVLGGVVVVFAIVGVVN